MTSFFFAVHSVLIHGHSEGITVNAALYIINEFNNIPESFRKNSSKAYLKAFNHKIIPIFLTITSTILGLTPFLIGGQNEAFWFAFAAGSIWGLIFSLIGLLVFLPAFFIKRKSSISTEQKI